MSRDKKQWSPDKEEALKALIRATIADAGPMAPDALPHKVKQALQGQATGDLDLDALIKKVLKETRPDQ